VGSFFSTNVPNFLLLDEVTGTFGSSLFPPTIRALQKMVLEVFFFFLVIFFFVSRFFKLGTCFPTLIPRRLLSLLG